MKTATFCEVVVLFLCLLYNGDMISIILPCSKDYKDRYQKEFLDSLKDNMCEYEIVEVEFNPKTDGFSHKLNEGIARAKGEWLLPHGIDDCLAPGSLDNLTQAIDNETDVIYGDQQNFGEEDRLLKTPESISFESLLCGNQIPFSSLIRKSKIQEVGGYWQSDKSNFCPEDWELWTRLAKNKARFKHIDSVILMYRIHQNQTWNTMKNDISKFKQIINERLNRDTTL
jgi:hypothetical protein